MSGQMNFGACMADIATQAAAKIQETRSDEAYHRESLKSIRAREELERHQGAALDQVRDAAMSGSRVWYYTVSFGDDPADRYESEKIAAELSQKLGLLGLTANVQTDVSEPIGSDPYFDRTAYHVNVRIGW